MLISIDIFGNRVELCSNEMTMADFTKSSGQTSGGHPSLVPIQIPGVYANGFELGFTGADVAIMLQLNGRPILSLNLSLTSAKALGNGLGEIVEEFEQLSGTKVLSIAELAELQTKSEAKGK
jgi:hypothetical protein